MLSTFYVGLFSSSIFEKWTTLILLVLAVGLFVFNFSMCLIIFN